MLLDFALPEHDRKLIPEGRISGPMPWVIAIMLFLTLLVAAAGLTLADAARQGGDDLAQRITVQIIEADPIARAGQRAAVAKKLRTVTGVIEVKAVADAQVRILLEPWLGSGIIAAGCGNSSANHAKPSAQESSTKDNMRLIITFS